MACGVRRADGRAALALLLGAGSLRETRAAASSAMDWLGAATFSIALACLTLFILQGPVWGWTSMPMAGLLLAAVGGFTLFVRVERRSTAPLLDLNLLRYPASWGCSCCRSRPAMLCRAAGSAAAAVHRCRGHDRNPRRDEHARLVGANAGRADAGGTAGASALGRDRIGSRTAGSEYRSTLAVAVRSRIRLDTVPAMLLIGMGPDCRGDWMDGLSVAVVPPERAGMATGIFSTTRVAGEGIALASVTAGLAALVRWHLDRLTIGSAQVRPLLAQHLVTGDLGRPSGWVHRPKR